MEVNFNNLLPPPEKTPSNSASSSIHSSPSSSLAESSSAKLFKPSSSREGAVSVASDADGRPSTMSEEAMVINETIEYVPLNYHWFYSSIALEKKIWLPMSHKDSASLEKVYSENLENIKKLRLNLASDEIKKPSKFLVLVKGGRFEVDLVDLRKKAIYWNETKPSEVQRCLWFFKENNEQLFQPYDEEYCQFLEREYEKTIRNNLFHKRIDFLHSETVSSEQTAETEHSRDSSKSILQVQAEETSFVFHSPSIMLHFNQASMLDEFGNLGSDAKRPRIVKRGIEEVAEKVEADEKDKIDHVCFVVHGIGEGCDLKFRPLVECVDDFRDIAASMIDDHLRTHVESTNLSGRIEFIPVSWHQELHRDQNGVDIRLTPLTLPSIPKLREYSNTTILDVLFYTSPIYCQRIISRVGSELNRLLDVFLARNPYFNGKISVVGHSLGTLILFDLLMHQPATNINEKEKEMNENRPCSTTTSETKFIDNLNDMLTRLGMLEFAPLLEKHQITMDSLLLLNESDLCFIGIPLGPRKILINEIKNNIFRRERDEVERKVKENVSMTNSSSTNSIGFFNYGLAGTGQPLIKYPKLDFRPAHFFALGSPIPMFLTVRGIEHLGTEFKLPTCDSFFNIFHPFDPVAYRLEPLVCMTIKLKPVLIPHHKGRKRLHLELREGLIRVEDLKQKMYTQINTGLKNAWSSLTSKIGSLPASSQFIAAPNSGTSVTTEEQTTLQQMQQQEQQPVEIDQEIQAKDLNVKLDFGRINKGRRVDYVLQERPIESFNEYLFAVASHACYWESEDTLLMLVKEIYDMGDMTDPKTELQLTEQQQQQYSWLTQATVSTLNANLQKTFSYFNSFGLPSFAK